MNLHIKEFDELSFIYQTILLNEIPKLLKEATFPHKLGKEYYQDWTLNVLQTDACPTGKFVIRITQQASQFNVTYFKK